MNQLSEFNVKQYKEESDSFLSLVSVANSPVAGSPLPWLYVYHRLIQKSSKKESSQFLFVSFQGLINHKGLPLTSAGLHCV
jgi:hypothetical protein